MEIAEALMSRADWDAELTVAGSPLQQSWDYGQAAAALGARVRRFEIDAGGPRGFAQVVTRRVGPLDLSALHRGPVWAGSVDTDTARAAVRGLAAKTKGILIVTPSEWFSGWGLIRLAAPRTEAVIDLSPDLLALRAGLHGKWRNRLVRAEAAGLTISTCQPGFQDLRPLIAHEAEQRRTRRYGGLPPAFLRAWTEVAPDQALLVQATDRTGLVAAMLFLTHGRAATYQLGWTSERGRRAHAHNALLWSGMAQLRARKITSVNLGVTDTEQNPGLARFKLGTGAVARRLGPTCLVLPAIRPRW
jgi:Acetyltransferase (GNAT) domain